MLGDIWFFGNTWLAEIYFAYLVLPAEWSHQGRYVSAQTTQLILENTGQIFQYGTTVLETLQFLVILEAKRKIFQMFLEVID